MSSIQSPEGLTLHNHERTYDGHVLFDTPDGNSRLINKAGEEVRVWPYPGFPSEMIDPVLIGGKKGHIFAVRGPNIFDNEALVELDWEGEVVWQWDGEGPDGKALQNHDVARLPSGNTILYTKREYERHDLSPDQFVDQPIVEISPDGAVVWEWIAHEHFDELGINHTRLADVFGTTALRTLPYILCLNTLQPLGPNKWFDACDDRFHPDNLMINSREANLFAIIARATGEIVWRIGPDHPASHDNAKRNFSGPCPKPVDNLSGQHDPHIIAPGLPGTGDILIFDNDGPAGIPPSFGKMHPGSRVLQIDPTTKEIVWQYDAGKSGLPNWAFYSSFISSARRLPNGNTLICEGMNGRIFEVTMEGEVVWEFINPHWGPWGGDRGLIGGDTGLRTNLVFRAQPVPNDWLPI